MGFSGADDLVNNITSGNYFLAPFQRLINNATNPGNWQTIECLGGIGTGGAMTLTGSAGVGAALDSTTAGSLPQPTTDVSPSTKHLITMSAQTNQVLTGFLVLTDLLYIYPSCVLTGTPTVFDNTAAKPARFNSGIGAQCSAFLVATAGSSNTVLTMTYTNSVPTGSRTGYLTNPGMTPVGLGFHGITGSTSNTCSPYMLLAQGDFGVNKLDSYVISSGGGTGAISFILHRPIATIPVTGSVAGVERDYVFQFPSLPKIDDAACLGLIFNTTNVPVSSSLYVELGCAWG